MTHELQRINQHELHITESYLPYRPIYLRDLILAEHISFKAEDLIGHQDEVSISDASVSPTFGERRPSTQMVAASQRSFACTLMKSQSRSEHRFRIEARNLEDISTPP